MSQVGQQGTYLWVAKATWQGNATVGMYNVENSINLMKAGTGDYVQQNVLAAFKQQILSHLSQQSADFSVDTFSIDGLSTDATSVEVLDLSLHNADDEDWFRFDADDDLYDDIDLRVTYTGPDDVEVKVQLYKLGWDTTIPWIEVTGTGEMILEDEGSVWTADEDLWAIRVLPATDDAIGCDTTYSLLIQA